jgi:hypothetical protein
VLYSRRELAQLAEIRTRQETAEQEVKGHKVSNVLHNGDLKYLSKVGLFFLR